MFLDGGGFQYFLNEIVSKHMHTHTFSLPLPCGAGHWTQGITHARQALYLWVTLHPKIVSFKIWIKTSLQWVSLGVIVVVVTIFIN